MSALAQALLHQVDSVLICCWRSAELPVWVAMQEDPQIEPVPLAILVPARHAKAGCHRTRSRGMTAWSACSGGVLALWPEMKLTEAYDQSNAAVFSSPKALLMLEVVAQGKRLSKCLGVL